MKLRLDIDSESTPDEIEAELEYWSEQLQIAIKIKDSEVKKQIMQVMKLVASWLDNVDQDE